MPHQNLCHSGGVVYGTGSDLQAVFELLAVHGEMDSISSPCYPKNIGVCCHPLLIIKLIMTMLGLTWTYKMWCMGTSKQVVPLWSIFNIPVKKK